MTRKLSKPQFLICINNDDYPASLEVRKVYRTVADAQAATRHFVRIIDESGEDYLYPESMFVPIELPQAVKNACFQV